MFFKILTSAIIIVGCTLLGMIYGNQFNKRMLLLQQLQNGMQQLENYITYSASPLPEAFEKIGHSLANSIGDFFLEVSNQLKTKKGMSMERIWEMTVKNFIMVGSLKNDDYLLLKDIGTTLGTTDRMNQKKNLELLQYQLKDQLKRAEQEKIKKQGLFRSLGVLSGITIAILLF